MSVAEAPKEFTFCLSCNSKINVPNALRYHNVNVTPGILERATEFETWDLSSNPSYAIWANQFPGPQFLPMGAGLNGLQVPLPWKSMLL